MQTSLMSPSMKNHHDALRLIVGVLSSGGIHLTTLKFIAGHYN